jgi:hypothetical protein
MEDKSINFMQVQGDVKDIPSKLTISIPQESESTIENVQQTLEDTLKDSKVRESGIRVATDIKELLRDNWFTIEQLQKKTAFKQYQAAMDLLNLLCLLELCYREVKLKGVIKYKIVLQPTDKLIVLQEELAEAKDKVDNILIEIERVKKQIN